MPRWNGETVELLRRVADPNAEVGGEKVMGLLAWLGAHQRGEPELLARTLQHVTLAQLAAQEMPYIREVCREVLEYMRRHGLSDDEG